MIKAPIPATEAERLAALRRYEILDTAPEEAFDDIVALAAQICRTPIALVSLVDEDRQWFKSHLGLSRRETARDVAFCAHVVLSRADLMEVNDATTDPRFADNPLVTDDPGIRFYAGAPMVTPEGHAIGSLCVIDRIPRQLTDEQRTALRILSRHAIAQMELRRRTRELQAEVDEHRRSAQALENSEKFLQSTLDALTTEIAILDQSGVILAVNEAWKRSAVDNSVASERLGPGANYLERCEQHASRQEEDAVAMTQGIRAVLSGVNREFRREYASHGPGEKRWFAVRVTRFGPEQDRRVVVAHENITERKQAEEELGRLHRELLAASREAGMAEVATSVLHNVGNVLNSVNVSATLIGDRLRRNSIERFLQVSALLRAQAEDLAGFFARDPRASHLPAYLEQFGQHLIEENRDMLAELENLRANIDHIRGIVTMQQSYARLSGVVEKIDPVALVSDALRMIHGALERHGVRIERVFEAVPALEVDKHKVLQILVNFLRNAIDACDLAGGADKRIVLRVHLRDDRVVFSVADNGIGIPPADLHRIFNHGFTTKKGGHGFGLHSGANAAREMGGAVSVHSDGAGCGARFALELPFRREPVLPAPVTPAPSPRTADRAA
jgi:signal transduction histidine kinase